VVKARRRYERMATGRRSKGSSEEGSQINMK
jgi:hypothetical protein